MTIHEKLSLYEYCRTSSGKSYYNLTEDRKKAILKEFNKLQNSKHPAVKMRMN